VNALGFKGYLDKVKAYQQKTGLTEAVVTGRATIEGIAVLVAIMDFRFLGASMGSVVGEKITRAIEAATAERKPVIVFSASGGARMHEGILSLMQMAKTSGALARHAEARLPYISVLTHPTTGGVTASFATLGDIIIAEPKCMIGFAGPRVVKETTHADLPPGFQTAEFMMQHGLVDMIVDRKDMRTTLAKVLRYMVVAKKA
jgi:acetyl-CoA carboxylase carboxyl transferase subunit beta